jgi:hypothetical protein
MWVSDVLVTRVLRRGTTYLPVIALLAEMLQGDDLELTTSACVSNHGKDTWA